jgi:hypothetical protein
MMIRRRGLLIVVLLGLSASASLVVAVAALIQRLPDPNTADRRGLFRWLVECDLKQESPDLQLTILRRVERELVAGVDFRDVMTALKPGQRRLLLQNADLLARCWFRQAADNYFAAPESQRAAILGQQLNAVRRLGIMDQLSALDQWSEKQQPNVGENAAITSATTRSTGTIPAAGGHWLEALVAQGIRIQRWIAEAAPQAQHRLSRYFAAMRDRLLADYFQQFGGLGNLLPSG